MPRLKETELASKLIAWLQSQGHKHLHEEVKVSGVGTADVVSCDGYITVYECKIGKHRDLLDQCDRWLGLAHAVYAVSNTTIPPDLSGIGKIVTEPTVMVQRAPNYHHDYNGEPIRSACNEHNAVGGSFAKAGSRNDKRATAENVKWQSVSSLVKVHGMCTAGFAALAADVTPLKLLKAVEEGLVPNVAITPMSGKSYLVYNP